MSDRKNKYNTKGGHILRRAGRVGESGSLLLPPRSIRNSMMGMRQLFDESTSTYTYLLWDKDTEDAILIDPVDTQVTAMCCQ